MSLSSSESLHIISFKSVISESYIQAFAEVAILLAPFEGGLLIPRPMGAISDWGKIVLIKEMQPIPDQKVGIFFEPSMDIGLQSGTLL